MGVILSENYPRARPSIRITTTNLCSE